MVFHIFRKFFISTLLCSIFFSAQLLFSVTRDFKIVESESVDNSIKYFLKTIPGTERTNNPLNRFSMLSEDQSCYPAPESGCGPTAMLNILIWYEKYGLIEPIHRDANPQHYKLKWFNEIDRRLTQQSGASRIEAGGVHSLDVAIVMDSIVSERSKNRVRIHTDIIFAPLQLSDLLNTMQNFRAGFLVVTPKDRITKELLQSHATVIVRADRAGYITLATWGKLYRGLLRKRSDGQWFIPQDPEHMELKIESLTRFIPFKPTS